MTEGEQFHTIIPGELAAGREFRLGGAEYHALVDIVPPLENPQGFLTEACGMGAKAVYLGNLVIGRNHEAGEPTPTYASRIHFIARGENEGDAQELYASFTNWLNTALTVTGEPEAQQQQAAKMYKPRTGGRS
jgi:hypothetical protein